MLLLPVRGFVLVATLAAVVPALPVDAQSPLPPRRVPSTGEVDGIGVPVMPSRRAVPARPAAVPSLPAGADRLIPLTVRLTVQKTGRDGRRRDVTQTLIRTVDRVHVAAGGGSEWLFERNPVDPRRVSGHFIDHASRTVVFYSDTDLSNMVGIPGWAHLLTFGCDPGAPMAAVPGAPTRTVGDVTFTRRPGSGTPARDAWWNQDLVLPADCTAGDGSARLVLDGVSQHVDATLLAPPATRFPAYRQVDVADWLEHP